MPMMRSIVSMVLLTTAMGACAKIPSCSAPETLELIKQMLEPHLAMYTMMPGLRGARVVIDVRDVVTVTQTDRQARCRATIEPRFEPSPPGAFPIGPLPGKYIVERTDDGRLTVRNDDGRAQP
jgi:hypothetical protein